MIPRLLFAILLAFPVLAAAQAFTNRSTEMKDRADPEGRTVATLPENTPVKVLSSAGGWSRVEAGGQAGWIRVFHVRHAGGVESAPSSAGGGLLSSLGSVLGGQRSNPRANLATTGVRGLSQEDLKNANPDPEALRRMQSYRSDRAAAERFAREGKLAAVQIQDPDAAPAPSKGGRR